MLLPLNLAKDGLVSFSTTALATEKLQNILHLARMFHKTDLGPVICENRPHVLTFVKERHFKYKKETRAVRPSARFPHAPSEVG